MTATSSPPSSPQLSRICLVACTSNGTVAYSHFGMDRPYAYALAARSGAVTSRTSGATGLSTSGAGGMDDSSSSGTGALEMAASAAATSASPRSSSSPGGSDGGAAGPGAIFSKNLSSSTGMGMTSVLFRSPATSTTVCSSRSCSAAGSRAITFAAAASPSDAWYSPSAVMIL